jgi:AcrR family transcriptional regulator
VDARLHHLQGKAELVIELLIEFYGEKLSALLQHMAHARMVTQYDANNTYQYVINREEVQLGWLATAIADAGGAVPEAAPGSAPSAGGAGKDAVRALFDDDIRNAQAFLDRWRPRVEALDNARHRGMLRVILGETREQQRFFEQALAGRTDLLGRRSSAGAPAMGEVLPARWIE